MTEPEALSLAWSVLRERGLQDEVGKVGSIHFSTAQERREVLGKDHPDQSDYWYVTFSLKLDDGVVSQTPDSILVQIDNSTRVATILAQM